MGWKTGIYITIFVLAIAMTITLLVFWNVVVVSNIHTVRQLNGERGQMTGRWTLLVLGILFITFVLTVLSVFFGLLMRNTRFKQQQKDFVNMMTHELKLPMSSIQVFAQTLRERKVSEEERLQFTDLILAECGRMNTLLQHLLKSQQIDRGGLPMERRRVNLEDLVRKFVEAWPRPLDLQATERLYVHADPALVEYALTNLVINAEKYGRKGSVPKLRLEASGRSALLSVEDEATPIPRKYQKRIFRRFYRIPNLTTRRQSGAGLGLYIVRNIAKAHRGRVQVVRAAPPSGNRFTLHLPRLA